MKDNLISRRAAVSRISDLLILELKGQRIPTWNEVYNAIGDIPSVPAVAVVRCTACRNWNGESGLTARMCSHWGKFTKQFDYCSYGEGQDEADRP